MKNGISPRFLYLLVFLDRVNNGSFSRMHLTFSIHIHFLFQLLEILESITVQRKEKKAEKGMRRWTGITANTRNWMGIHSFQNDNSKPLSVTPCQ
mmetsp:Transcript_27077/g.55432  ORF Transcript_27077/g.55432 Transcript_27077/m.55432 type:complete len:95 (-) Transcript_27077:816-1100(-)